MATALKSHIDVTLYGVVAARRMPHKAISALLRISRRNRMLCERHGHDWGLVRTDVINMLRTVDAARAGEMA